MKGLFIFLLLIIAIIVATVQHVRKSNPQGDRIDKMAEGLKIPMEHLPPSSSLKFSMPDGAPGDGYILWRYILAPRYASIRPTEKFDTTLAICNKNMSDSALHSITGHRRVISSSEDEQYKYLVTCSER